VKQNLQSYCFRNHLLCCGENLTVFSQHASFITRVIFCHFPFVVCWICHSIWKLFTHLLFLPAEFIQCPLKLVHTLPQCIVSSCLLCSKVVVCLLNYVMVCLSKTSGVGHLSVSTLLVVSTEVLPLLRGGTPVSQQTNAVHSLSPLLWLKS